VAEVIEKSNVTLQCKASGHPKPTIGWRREDGEPIKLTGGGASTPPADTQPKLAEDRNPQSNVVVGPIGPDRQAPARSHAHKSAAKGEQQTITRKCEVSRQLAERAALE
jgi:hypothetical protein